MRGIAGIMWRILRSCGLVRVGRLVRIKSIDYLSDWSEVNPENDNMDVSVVLEDERQYMFVVATPNNVFWCMDNEGRDYFFGEPMIFVKNLTVENVEKAINAILNEDGGRWLGIYG
jgi:hypothetical protein